ncbi:DgyrCDS4369 [Dimorphilus gyrociliatus]|uniref:DgyrCDS4369 n=1 Tax=Dimorphilus gyrociliatus TaxID=2664684 RepID=A0A7I8VIA6_9ANNE|nr:DgyrCDS4369 [Dimorphilus gyrociliatus]
MQTSGDERLSAEFVVTYSVLTFFLLLVFALSFLHYHIENREKYQRRRERIEALKDDTNESENFCGVNRATSLKPFVRTRMSMLYNKIDVKPIVTHFALGFHEDLSVSNWSKIIKSPMGRKRKKSRWAYATGFAKDNYKSFKYSSNESSSDKTDSDHFSSEIEDCAHSSQTRKAVNKPAVTKTKAKSHMGSLSVGVSVLNNRVNSS